MEWIVASMRCTHYIFWNKLIIIINIMVIYLHILSDLKFIVFDLIEDEMDFDIYAGIVVFIVFLHKHLC